MPDPKSNKNTQYGQLEEQRTGDNAPRPAPGPLHSPTVAALAEDGRSGLMQRTLDQVEACAAADRALIRDLFHRGRPGVYEARTTLLRLPSTERQRLETWGRK